MRKLPVTVATAGLPRLCRLMRGLAADAGAFAWPPVRECASASSAAASSSKASIVSVPAAAGGSSVQENCSEVE